MKCVVNLLLLAVWKGSRSLFKHNTLGAVVRTKAKTEADTVKPLSLYKQSLRCTFKITRLFSKQIGTVRLRPLSLQLSRQADELAALIRDLSADCRISEIVSTGYRNLPAPVQMQAIKCVVVGDG